MQIILDDGRVYTVDQEGNLPELGLQFIGAMTMEKRKILRPYFWVEVLREANSIPWKKDGRQWTFLHTAEGVWKGGRGIGRGYKACGYILVHE